MTDGAPDSRWDGSFTPDPRSVARLTRFTPGTSLTIVKRAPSGVETARYPAVVVESSAPEPWIEVEAVWTRDRVEVGGLEFEPGDTLREFFSAEHPFNAFAVFAPGGEHRGWYGNVTYPAFFDTVDGEDVLVWHDLYLDVVMLPDGATHLLDDDELAGSGLFAANLGFAAAIVEARWGLIATIPTLMRRSDVV